MKIKTMYFLFFLFCIHLISHTYHIKTDKQTKNPSSYAVFRIMRFLERRRISSIVLLSLLIQARLQQLLVQHYSTLYDKKHVKQTSLGYTSFAWAKENKWADGPWEVYSSLYTRIVC